jgi:transposase
MALFGMICYAPSVSDTVDQDQRIVALEAALASANAALAARDLLIETLRVQIARMRRMKFGASSEKLDHAIAQLELALEELEAEASTVAQSKPLTAKPVFPCASAARRDCPRARTGQLHLPGLRRRFAPPECRQ